MVPDQQLEGQRGPAHILLVEDDMLVRMLIADELRGAGFSVVETARADEAWTYLKSGGEVDLVFSDIEVPGAFNGLELARKINKDYPVLPIILTSGIAWPQGKKIPAPFIAKPYNAALAVARIVATLQLTKSGPSL